MAALSSLLAIIAVSTNLEVPVLTSLFSSNPKPTELGVNFDLAMGFKHEPCPVTRLKAQECPLVTKEGLVDKVCRVVWLSAGAKEVGIVALGLIKNSTKLDGV